MDNEFNAFAEGVAAGGLRNTTQIKLLVEYLAENLKEPATSEIMVEALITHGLANYFEASQAVDDLLKNGSLIKDREGCLRITSKGSQEYAVLKGDLPTSVRERAYADATAVQMRLKNQGENKARIIDVANGYNVVCTVLHKDEILMELTLYAADYEQAEKIRDVFTDDPAKVYSTVVSMLYS